jgi:dienelactone hydrolase
VIERTIAAVTHGRYLVHAPAGAGPWPVLVGFHGYAESADLQLERLRGVPGSDRWLLVAVQGLHRFYRGRGEEIVAGWMTRQDRELAIADNVAYVVSIAAEIRRDHRVAGPLVVAGFSQGVAMAFRAARPLGAAAVMALGGDIPPELDAAALRAIPVALVARGSRDGWYTDETFAADAARLREAGAAVDAVTLDAGHEWTDAFNQRAGEFLGRLS